MEYLRSWRWSAADVVTPHPDFVKHKAQRRRFSAMAGCNSKKLQVLTNKESCLAHCTGVDLGVILLKVSLVSKWAKPLKHLFGVRMEYSHFGQVLKSKIILTVGMGRCSEDFHGRNENISIQNSKNIFHQCIMFRPYS